MERWLHRGPAIRRAILLVLLVGIPLIFVRGVSDPINAPKLSLLLGGLSLVGGIRLIEVVYGGSVRSLRRLVLPVLFLCLPLLLSWLAAPYKEWSLFGSFGRFQGLIPYVAVALFGLLLADSFGGRAAQLAWALAATGAVVASYALVQWAGWDPFTWYRLGAEYEQATSTLGNTNYVGGFLAMTLPICVGLVLALPPHRLVALVLTSVTLGGLIVSFSQGGWAAAAAGSLFTLLFVAGTRWSWLRVVAGSVGFLAGIGVAGIVVLSMLVSNAPFVSNSITVRGWHWQAAAGMATRYPLLGRGPNAFAVEGVQYRPVPDGMHFGYFFTDQPHSMWFSVLTAAGVLGVLGFVLLILWVVRRASDTPSDSVLGAAFIGAVVAYLIQSLVSIDELSLRVALWGALAGIVAVRAEKNEGAYRLGRVQWRTRVAAVGIAVLAILGLVWSTRFLIADVNVGRGLALFEQGEVGPARAKFRRALAFRDEFHYRHLFGAHLGRAAIAAEDSRREDLREEMDRAFSYLDAFPHVIGLRDRASYLRVLASDDESLNETAVDLLERAQRLDPVNPLIRVDLADILLDQGREDEAYRRLRRIMFLIPHFSEYWGALALAEARLGRFEQAQASIDWAFFFDPAEPRAHRAAALVSSHLEQVREQDVRS